QAALDRPRFCIEPANAAGVVSLELGVPPQVVTELERRGHIVKPKVSGYARHAFGRGQIIRREPDGVLWGGSDPHAEGCALGF
ncbi:MAG: gamma-glutamyltransferase, partial [Chloroflexi bacterium]|nr:gamma-glutamyltransferase [Chloroflexota bacterium]